MMFMENADQMQRIRPMKRIVIDPVGDLLFLLVLILLVLWFTSINASALK